MLSFVDVDYRLSRRAFWKNRMTLKVVNVFGRGNISERERRQGNANRGHMWLTTQIRTSNS